MVQRREDFRFALKAGQSVRVGCQRRWEDLDGDLTLQLRVCRPIDFPHPTHAKLSGDFVWAEEGAGREGQAIFVDYTGGTAALTGLLLRDAAVSSEVVGRAVGSIGRSWTPAPGRTPKRVKLPQPDCQ